jgi:hypothetical protein
VDPRYFFCLAVPIAVFTRRMVFNELLRFVNEDC